MAYTTATPTRSSVLSLLARPFTAIWSTLIAIAEAGPKMREINALNDTTDAQLAARGTTRLAEVQRILGNRMYL